VNISRYGRLPDRGEKRLKSIERGEVGLVDRGILKEDE